MTHVKYWVVDEDDEEPEEITYSNIIEEEDYEDDPPEGFEGAQKGSDIHESSEEALLPRPWDPTENFFAYI
jgi:hypothetical protein